MTTTAQAPLMYCTECGHRLNPRSETCGERHPACTAEGCTPPGYRLGWVGNPLGGYGPAHIHELAQATIGNAPNRLVDLASYQQGINLATVKAAGFGAVNIKLTQGISYTWGAGRTYADAARALGMGICTFTWIDNSASGASQAQYAWRQMQAIGGPDGMAHQCDCEDSARPATLAIWRDYVSWWQDKLGRHIVNYTGDWWWVPRGWSGSQLTPYLWAGPNNGYLSSYPGDTSSAWHAGYGGWSDYSLLQYAVQPVPNAGGGNLSKTAIRDPAVWAALTGGAGDADMTPEEHNRLVNIDATVNALVRMADVAHLTVGDQANEIAKALNNLAAGPVDVAALAAKVTAGLIASNTNGLTEADHAGVKADVEQVIGEYLRRATTGTTG